MNDHEPGRPAEVDADDQRLAAEPVRQPAGEERHRHREDDQRAVHQAGRRLVDAEDPGQVDQGEQVHHPEPAPAAAEHRGEVQPAQVGSRAGSAPKAERTLPPATAAARSVPRSRTNSRIAMAMTMAGSPKTIDAPRQPTAAMSGTPIERDHHRADVAAGDVRADREPAPLRRELLGEQAVADRVLLRAADPRQDVRDGEGARSRWRTPGRRTRRRTGSRRSPAAARRETTRVSARIAQLDEPGQEAPGGRQERDGFDPDPELVDDLEEDQRQQYGLRVVDRVGHGQQAEGPHRVDRRQLHPRMVRHRWPTRLGQSPGAFAGCMRGFRHRGAAALHDRRHRQRPEGIPPMPKVLIVDDEQHIRLLIEQTLEELEDDGCRAADRGRRRRGGRASSSTNGRTSSSST